MSPLKEIRPATEREDLVVNFPNRFRGQKNKSETRELLEKVVETIDESPNGVAALDFEGKSRGGEAFAMQNKLRNAGNRDGLELQTTLEYYPEKAILFVRRFKESG